MSFQLPHIEPVSDLLDVQIQTDIDQKTKPLGALGQLEKLAFRIARIQQVRRPQLQQPTVLVFAADHGIANAGVSAYPQDVTWQMVHNFLQGGAAINVFGRQHNISVKVVDVGVNHEFGDLPGLIQAKVKPGADNLLEGPAMTVAECEQAMQVGINLAAEAAGQGSNALGLGEMGIGNTSAAAMLMSRLLGLPLSTCVGRGTGLNDTQLAHKIALLEQVDALHQGVQDPLDVLSTLGGIEVAAMTGAMLEAASRRMIILVDGFIASAAYLVAYKLNPEIADYAVFCHCSDEQGHRSMLEQLDAKPLLQLSMRLGEGSGCALAYPLLQSAVAMLTEMASFADAGVSDKGSD